MSLFDPNQLLETRHTDEIDTKFHLVPECECMGQVADVRLREGQSERVSVTWANLDIVWDVVDENIKSKMNMSRVQVTQQMFLDLVTNGSGEIAMPVQINWSTNRNMPLKRVMDATGVKRTNFALNDLKMQTAWLKIEHEVDSKGATNADGTPVKYARVTRTAPLSAAKAGK